MSFAATDSTAPRSHIPVPERKSYYPEWGQKHDNLSLPVLSGGVPTGFHVGDILFEKRWAISADSGEILDQAAFEPLFKRWNALACTTTGQIIPIASVNRNFNPEFESCPEARQFVMTTVDEDGRQIPVGWDSRSEEVATGPRKLWDASGENAKTATETLVVFRAQKAMKELQSVEKLKNILPADTYQAKVDEVLAKHGLTVDDLTAGLADAPEGFDRTPISEDDIARLEKMAAEETEQIVEKTAEVLGGLLAEAEVPEPAVFLAPCGKECKSKAGAAAHARNCDACKAPAEGMSE